MRALTLLTIALMTYLFYGFYISSHKIEILQDPLRLTNSSELFDYRGITHSHSLLSTGIGEPEELIEAAENSEMDFLFITDSNTFDHAYELEGYQNNLLVFVFEEFDYLDSRFLRISQNRNRQFNTLGDVQIGFADILSNRNSESTNEYVILTHPLLKNFQWTRPFPPGLFSLEALNLKSIWQNTWKESTFSGAWSILVYPFNPELALVRLFSSADAEFKLWDQLNQKSPTIGYFGHDATARALPFKGVPIRFPSYEAIFKIGSNHVWLRSELTGNSYNDRKKILSALRKGQFYMSFDFLGNPKGFRTQLISSTGKLLPGARVPFRDDLLIETSVPESAEKKFEIRYIHNGEVIYKSRDHVSRLALSEPGTYRVEVWVNAPLPFPDRGKDIMWIATNPFFISP